MLDPDVSRARREAARKKRQRDGHWIYGISDGAAIKVGYAMDVKKRVQHLQIGNPRELVVVYLWRVTQWKNSTAEITNAKRWEKRYHRALSAHALRGEWFGLGALPEMMKLNAPCGGTNG